MHHFIIFEEKVTVPLGSYTLARKHIYITVIAHEHVYITVIIEAKFDDSILFVNFKLHHMLPFLPRTG